MMNDGSMIYGATGVTGRLIAQRAVKIGLRPVLAGRSAASLRALAGTLGLEDRCFALDDAEMVLANLHDVSCVLNAAGPFSHTADPVIDGCIAAGSQYMDITGEVDVLHSLAARGAAAEEAGIGLLPGAGFEVTASDCLLRHVSDAVGGARELRLFVLGQPGVTPGSARTMVELAGRGTAVMRNGAIRWIEPTPSDELCVDGEFVPVTGISSGDVATGGCSTGAIDISVFASRSAARGGLPAATPPPLLRFADRLAGWWSSATGRNADETAGRLVQRPGMTLIAEARNLAGRRAAARLTTPEVYGLTAQIAAETLRRALGGAITPGFHTPARLFGADFILDFDGVRRMDTMPVELASRQVGDHDPRLARGWSVKPKRRGIR